MKTYWTCVGAVRGKCGVKHRSLDAAMACCMKDHRSVQRYFGKTAYSDRRPSEKVDMGAEV